jgi:hypothetical protein
LVFMLAVGSWSLEKSKGNVSSDSNDMNKAKMVVS